MLTCSSGIDKGSFGQGDLPLLLHTGDTNQPPEPHLISDSDKRALERLVGLDPPQDDSIKSIVSNVKAVDIVKCLQSSDAQRSIDVIDEACHHTTLSPRNWLTDLRSTLLFLLVRR